jgi:hypothetical protein
MAQRLKHLDEAEFGRVPKIEQRVDAVEDDLASVKRDAAVAATNTEWIVKHLDEKQKART